MKEVIKKILKEDFEWMNTPIDGGELRELIDKNKATTIPFQHVVGSLNLKWTPIKDLGNLKSVVGDLYLINTRIKDLGNLQSVEGDLNLINTRIKDLGNLQSVEGHLYLMGTPLSKKYSEEEIRQQVSVGGNIYL